MAKTITDKERAYIFKQLASKTLYEVGVEFGLDKHYKTAAGIRTRIYGIYNQVRANPEKFFLQQETIDLVVAAVAKRSLEQPKPTLKEKSELSLLDVKELTLTGRDKIAKLINKKLDYIDKHPGALKAESLVSLTKAFGTLFDKGQIIQGQATEHVAVMGNIDTNLSPDDAIDLVLQMREQIQADREK